MANTAQKPEEKLSIILGLAADYVEPDAAFSVRCTSMVEAATWIASQLTREQVEELRGELNYYAFNKRIASDWALHDRLAPQVGDTIEFSDYEGSRVATKIRQGKVIKVDALDAMRADNISPSYIVNSIKGVKGTRTVYPRHVISITTTRKVED